MKYQITCDNCGTQFIIDAGEGQTIECNCPNCHSVMEITLPLVNENQPSDDSQNIEPTRPQTPDRTVLWGVIIGLAVVAIAALAYFTLTPSEAPVEDPKAPEITDTIPYDTPEQQIVAPQIDTVRSAPAKKEEVEEEQPEERHHRQENDSTEDMSAADFLE